MHFILYCWGILLARSIHCCFVNVKVADILSQIAAVCRFTSKPSEQFHCDDILR